ncbi:MAG TPA: NAD(P)H-hydrate dehydratase [Longimicrobiales bacterium]|nr:NAD(P)H-hydrate dehydratase [Longimicrobiales bacterium]
MSPLPPLRPFGRTRVPVCTGEESARFDARAIQQLGVPQPVLMENAGRSAAQILQFLYPAGPVVGLVGAGNNGGDTLVLLRTLAAWGRDVRALVVADRGTPEPVLHAWDVPTTSDEALDEAGWDALLASAGVVVDGVLGTGVRGAPRPRQASAIRRMNAAGRPVLAMDIPSGVDAGTGATAGEAVRADVTVAFGFPKVGSLLHPGRACTGRLLAVEIAFPPMADADVSALAVTPAWAQAHLPTRGLDTHKNAVGRVVVVAGSPGMAGAAVLAVRGALRAGAGLVQVCSPPENRTVLQTAVPEAIYVDPENGTALEDALAQAAAVAVGPGLGTGSGAEALLRRVVVAGAAPLVADADALNLLAQGRPCAVATVAADRPVLVTPHPGEMGRLVDADPDRIAGDRLGVARAAAEALECTVLLKGAPSVVAASGAALLMDLQGSSDLAVAGMGDVLTGVCVGLLAQGLTPREAAAVGLHLSGRAAVIAGRGRSLTPPDVLRRLSEALAERGGGDSDLDFPFLLLDLDRAR